MSLGGRSLPIISPNDSGQPSIQTEQPSVHPERRQLQPPSPKFGLPPMTQTQIRLPTITPSQEFIPPDVPAAKKALPSSPHPIQFLISPKITQPTIQPYTQPTQPVIQPQPTTRSYTQPQPSLTQPSTPVFHLESSISGGVCPLGYVENTGVDLEWNLGYPPVPPPNSEYKSLTCLAEGNCFFHGFLRTLDKIYLQSYDISEYISERQLRKFEKETNKDLIFPPGTLDPERQVQKAKQYRVVNREVFDKEMMKYRIEMACNFRRKMANFVLRDEGVKRTVLKYFPTPVEIQEDIIREGYPQLSDDQVKMYSLNAVLTDIADRINQTGGSIEPDVLILLSDLFNVDIYMLSEERLADPDFPHPFPGSYFADIIHGPRDMRLPNDPFLNHPERKAIVIMHQGREEGHYDIVARFDQDGQVITSFDQNEPLIRTLYEWVVKTRFD